MKQGLFSVTENRALTSSVYLMEMEGDTSAIIRPGQFVNIKIDGTYLRRPLSVCDAENGKLVLIYKVVGHGTESMSRMLPGKKLDLLTGLGNGYDTEMSGTAPLLLGGGVGIPPLYWLAKRLIGENKQPMAVLGFNTKDEIFYEDEFRELGCTVQVTTADGSYGVHGFVTDAFPERYSYIYTCGPEPMLKAVWSRSTTSGQFSFEERMGCGFGACMGCRCRTLTGYKRICREGPVLRKEEILWKD